MSLNNYLPRIAITSGEPAGIGPDICVMLAQHRINADITVIGDADMLTARARQLNIDFSQKNILHIPTNAPVVTGKLDPANSPYVLATLTAAITGCKNGQFDAIVTAPVHKGVINDAGIAFTGHTEFFAEQTHTEKVVMMLVGGDIRVALATIHLALKEVSSAITRDSLESTIRILHQDLVTKFGLPKPQILVCGLNPHAGEDGYLGREEIETINPVLLKLRAEGMTLIGALPADTLFTQHNLEKADAVLAMYHDQGLPVLKYASFGGGVNITLGLPIIRTSVDHGTALDLAGSGNINIGSMQAAVDLAIELVYQSQAKKIQ
jgi:4-hydroxythreonine-4-phosphate dehydrogenase